MSVGIFRALRNDPALAHVPALPIRGQGNPHTWRAARELGADFLSKPRDWTVIAQRVRDLVNTNPVPTRAPEE